MRGLRRVLNRGCVLTVPLALLTFKRDDNHSPTDELCVRVPTRADKKRLSISTSYLQKKTNNYFLLFAGSHITRLREARRIQRLQRIASPSTSDESNSSPCPPTVDKAAQNRVILELAWKTVALMHKNRLIQQKIIDLQKETSQYIQSVMSNPENRRRYMEHVRLYGAQPTQLKLLAAEKNVQVKVEPKA